MKLGFQPVNLSAEFYGNAVHPAESFALDSAVNIYVAVS